MRMSGRTATAAVGAVVAVGVFVAGVVLVLLGGSGGGATSAGAPGSSARPPRVVVEPGGVLRPAGPCATPARRGFEPKRISIDGVTTGAPVVGVARDSAGVPGVLPTSEKSSFAWNLDGIEPGDRRGNVLLNTHTWPDGSALGNALLRALDPRDRIVVRGGGEVLCYRVTRRLEVLAVDGYPPYYATDGPPQLAIVVCSGERLGPGQWTKRTIWFARPVGSASQ